MCCGFEKKPPQKTTQKQIRNRFTPRGLELTCLRKNSSSSDLRISQASVLVGNFVFPGGGCGRQSSFQCLRACVRVFVKPASTPCVISFWQKPVLWLCWPKIGNYKSLCMPEKAIIFFFGASLSVQLGKWLFHFDSFFLFYQHLLVRCLFKRHWLYIQDSP